jgi:hypothetical protein
MLGYQRFAGVGAPDAATATAGAAYTDEAAVLEPAAC